MQSLVRLLLAAVAAYAAKNIVLNVYNGLSYEVTHSLGTGDRPLAAAVVVVPVLVGIGTWLSSRSWDGRWPVPAGLRFAGALIGAWVVVDAVLTAELVDARDPGPPASTVPALAGLVTFVVVLVALRRAASASRPAGSS